MGDRRPQMVFVRRRRRGVRDRHGGDRSGRQAPSSGVADHRPRRHPRGRDRGRPRSSAMPVGAGLRTARSGTAESGSRSSTRWARRATGFGSRRSGSGRAGSTTSCAGSVRCSGHSSCFARTRSSGGVRVAARRQADGAELDCRLGGGDPRLPFDDARRGAQDRCGRRGSGGGLGDQVLRGAGAPRRDRPRGPGSRCARSTDETPLAEMYANARAARIYDGPDEVHRMVVSRRILKEFEQVGMAVLVKTNRRVTMAERPRGVPEGLRLRDRRGRGARAGPGRGAGSCPVGLGRSLPAGTHEPGAVLRAGTSRSATS